jgi:hypothetical protein
MSESSVTTLYTPLPPSAQSAIKPIEVTDEQKEKYSTVFEHFTQGGYTLPGIEEGALTEAEKFWLSYECLYRYLRASKWVVATCIQRIEATLKWRREYGLYDIVNAAHVEPEAVTGKQVLFGYDLTGRPALYLLPSRQNTTDTVRQVQFTVWMLERTMDLMAPGVETLALLINFADKAKNPSLGVAKQVLNILQDHYPERLGLALIINVPFLVNAFFKLILPFVDPVTRNKIKFNPSVVDDGLFAPDMVTSEGWGGSVMLDYVHEKYWPALVSMTNERREAWMKKWREMGGTIGLKELEYKQANIQATPVIDHHARPEDVEKVNSHTDSSLGAPVAPQS